MMTTQATLQIQNLFLKKEKEKPLIESYMWNPK
jgi:hypothetical protein